MTGGAEPVEVVGAGSQAGQFDVHTVRRVRRRGGDAALFDAGEPLVGGHLPLHVDRACRHAAESVVGQRVRRQPGPDHHSVCGRVTGRHPEGERIRLHRAETTLGGEPGDWQRDERNRAFQHRATARAKTGDTDTAKCQRAIFRDGDGQPYGVRLRRCCYANRLCTLPFRVTNDSYRDGRPIRAATGICL